ncbi:MAG TPA: hypothetical protein PKD16_16995 [Saprospiraceae bacterium]|nr:hypothetical protein [Saprospiraceae bacterium]HMT71868.1 hypothetical protein [Saprospiraceae bacterium]
MAHTLHWMYILDIAVSVDFKHEVINNYKEFVVDKSNVKLLPYQAVILKIK